MKKVAKKVAAKTCEKTCHCDSACTCGCQCGVMKKVVLGVSVAALLLSGWAVMKAGCTKTFENYIKQNPEVILDSVNAFYEAKRANRGAEMKVAPKEIIDEIVADKSNYSLGNPKGKFVIIEFFDHQCGWCKKTNAEMRAAVASAEGKNIRWIPIDTPIFGEASQTIARYVLAAGKQGKYAAMHTAVGEAKTKLDEAALIELGKKLGLNGDKLKADANSKEIRGKLEANQKYAKQLSISGVPMVIVDGKINPGALIGDKLKEAVKASQAKK